MGNSSPDNNYYGVTSRLVIDFYGSLLHNWHHWWLQFCIADAIHLCCALDVRLDRLWRVLAHQLLVLVLEQHVVDRGKTDAGTEDVVDAGSLAEQGVDEWRAAWHERGFAEETQDRQHWVETAKHQDTSHIFRNWELRIISTTYFPFIVLMIAVNGNW